MRSKHISASALLIILATITACDPSGSRSTDPEWEVRVFASEYSGYGYDIYRNDIHVVHQSRVPAIAVNAGFPSRQQARKTALFAIGKLKCGEQLPALTIEDLNSLGALATRADFTNDIDKF